MSRLDEIKVERCERPRRDRGIETYLERNQWVCGAYGIQAGLTVMQERAVRRKDCPQWLLEAIDSLATRITPIIPALVEHRDELQNAKTQYLRDRGLVVEESEA